METKYKVLAVSQKGEGLLPMKESPEKEAEKSDKQKLVESCNFIKNAFVADGEVSCVKFDKPMKLAVGFVVRDSKRGDFLVCLMTMDKFFK